MHRCLAVRIFGWEKFYNLIDSGCLNFTLYFTLEKKICIVSQSLMNYLLKHLKFAIRKKTKQNNQHCFSHICFMLACQATWDKKALAWPIVSLIPGYQTAFLSCPALCAFCGYNFPFHSDRMCLFSHIPQVTIFALLITIKVPMK